MQMFQVLLQTRKRTGLQSRNHAPTLTSKHERPKTETRKQQTERERKKKKKKIHAISEIFVSRVRTENIKATK